MSNNDNMSCIQSEIPKQLNRLSLLAPSSNTRQKPLGYEKNLGPYSKCLRFEYGWAVGFTENFRDLPQTE